MAERGALRVPLLKIEEFSDDVISAFCALNASGGQDFWPENEGSSANENATTTMQHTNPSDFTLRPENIGGGGHPAGG